MAKKLKLDEIAKEVLSRSEEPLTPQEITNKAIENGFVSEEAINADSMQTALYKQKELFIKASKKPTTFVLKDEWTGSIAENQETDDEEETTFFKNERQMHPYLSWFAFNHLRCYTKTINHQESSRKGKFKKWLHPDVVGCCFPFTGPQPISKNVLDFAKANTSAFAKYISFEIKQYLSDVNLRPSFFQCLSNSTWANETYLCAGEINTEDNFQMELNRLCAHFGIGIIELDGSQPQNSRILIPAVKRPTLDWATIGKSEQTNPDFAGFLESVASDIKGNKIHNDRNYDSIYSLSELPQSLEASL